MSVKAMLELIAKDSASSEIKRVDGALSDLESNAASTAASVSRSFDAMQKSMDSFSGPSAKPETWDFGSKGKTPVASSRDSLEDEESFYRDHYDELLSIRVSREEEWVKAQSQSLSQQTSQYDAWLNAQAASSAAAAEQEMARRNSLFGQISSGAENAKNALMPLFEASSKYAAKVGEATKGNDSFINGLGHLSVAAKTAAEGGIEGTIAKLDLLKMGYSVIVPVISKVVSMAYETADAFARQADAASDTAAIVGSTTRQYSGLSEGIRLLGEDTDRIQQSITAMSFRMREALETTGELQGVMGRYGVTLTDSNGIVKTSTDLLLEYADVFAAMPAGPQKTAAAMQIFGRSGAALIPVLDKGSGALRAQMQIAEGLGATYTDLDADIAGSLQSAQGRVEVFSKAIYNAFGRVATPVVTAFMDTAVDLATNVFIKLADGASGLQIRLGQVAVGADPSRFRDLGEAISDTADDMSGLNEISNDLRAAIDLSNDQTAPMVAGFRKRAAAIDEERFKKLDLMKVGVAELELERDRLSLIGLKTQKDRESLKDIEASIEASKKKIVANGGETESYRSYAKALAEAKSAQQAFDDAKQLEIKSDEAVRAKKQEIFQERVKLMVEAKSDAEDMAIAVIRADRSILEAEGKMAEDRATIAQTLSLSRVKAEQGVFDEQVRLQEQRQNSALEIQQAEISAMTATAKAETDLQIDRKTVAEQSKQARIAAERAVFDESVKVIQLRENAAQNLQRGILAAETKLVSDQQALDVERATSAQQLASKRIELAKAIFDAEQSFAEARDTREDDLRRRRIEAAQAVFDAETDLIAKSRNADLQIAQDRIAILSDITDTRIAQESLAQTAGLRTVAAISQADLALAQQRQANDEDRATRGQQIAQAQIQLIGQLIAQETQISVVRQQSADRAMLGIFARRNAELDLAQKTLQIEQIKAQLADRDLITAQARKDAELQEYQIQLNNAQTEAQILALSERGLSVTQSTAGAFGAVNSAARSVVSSVGQIAAGIQNASKLAGQLGTIIEGVATGVAGASIKIGEMTVAVPQDGITGISGMMASQDFQANVASAQAIAEAQRRNKEAADIAAAQKDAARARMSDTERARQEIKDEIEARKKSAATDARTKDLRLELMRLDAKSQTESTNLQTQFTQTSENILIKQREAQMRLQNQQSILEFKGSGTAGIQGLMMEQKINQLRLGIQQGQFEFNAMGSPTVQGLMVQKGNIDESLKRRNEAFNERFGFGGGGDGGSSKFKRDLPGNETIGGKSLAAIIDAIRGGMSPRIFLDGKQITNGIAPHIARGVKTGSIPISARGLVNDS